MKIKSILLASAFMMSLSVMAQEAVKDTTWRTGGVVGASFNQVSLSNWAAGGSSSISGNGLIGLFANMSKGKISWDNSLDLGYGLLKQEGGRTVKTDDRIDFTSKFGRQAWKPTWFYSALANFRTQFVEGYAGDLVDTLGISRQGPVISDFLAPAYVLASLGIDHKPNEHFSMFISPLTAKFTIVNDQDLADAGAFGVQAATFDGSNNLIARGENSRSEFGAYAKLAYAKDLMQNVGFLTKADFFMNYEEPTHVDVAWDALLSLKVNDYITTTLGATILYDHDIAITDADGKTGPRTQFKQIFGVGFAYQLK